ncbi:succinylglutamate desuccinylase/aspartoacylase family protein, partial [Conexibacter stalactiti]
MTDGDRTREAARAAEAPRHARRELPAGGATLVVDELRGADGPTVALLGGVHGDEPEGVLAVRRVVAELRAGGLRGTLRALAVANPL